MSRARLVFAQCVLGALLACGGPGTPGPELGPSALTGALEEDPGGVGSIMTRSERGDVGRLRLEKVVVRAKQAGDVADVVVEHTFVSDAAVPLEGTFRFPMPDGAIVTGLAMLIDGKMIEGELVDNEKARKIYEEIVDSMRDPALMEWEHGSTFKVRVFPIEPGKPKVVSMRYAVPLRKKASAYVYAQGTRALDDGDTLANIEVEWNGKPAFAGRDVARGRVVEIPAAPPPVALREERDDGVYTAVRVRPEWAKMEAPAAAAPRNWIVVVDTSRSALEERKLGLEALRTVLNGLPDGSRFVVATSDLETRLAPRGQGLAPKSASALDAAVRYVEATLPDGATDLGEMLRVVGEAATSIARSEGAVGVVYIGDCEPSWGLTSPSALRERAQTSLAGVPLYPLLLGGSVDAELARELASATAGRSFRAHAARDVASFAASLASTPKRLSNAELVAAPGVEILPSGKMTLDEGDEIVALVRAPRGQVSPEAITLRGENGGREVSTSVALRPTSERLVARRFGAAWVHELERLGKPRDEVVRASLEYSVMSKHTSFLVLESEEAYERFAIERRAKRANEASGDVHVSTADISLDRIQPGDPEILVDAPRDATRVIVVLPSGETKVAVWDADAREGRGAWMVRFLVDKGTPEGTYEARVFIEHADGRIETRSVTYRVDTTEPTLDVRVTPARGKRGLFEIAVTQRGLKPEIDTRRVEVFTPDGQSLALSAVRWGEFHGAWRPRRPVSGETIRVVGFDQALNHTSLEVKVPR